MQTIYNAQGEAKECEAVDAREHIETGRWFSEAPKVFIEQSVEISSQVDVQAVQEVVKRAYKKRN